MGTRRSRIFGSVQGVLVFAAIIYGLIILDIATRASFDAVTRAKLSIWLVLTAVMMFRIVRLLKKIGGDASGWSDAERMLLQLAALMPVAAIFPLSFV